MRPIKKFIRMVIYALHGMRVPPESTGAVEAPTKQSTGETSMITQYPRTLFVLKFRENPYDGAEKENGNWGDGGDGKTPLSSGLFNSARMVAEMLEQKGVPVKLVHVIDANFIHREIVAFKAEVVVIEAFWVVPAKFEELLRVCPKVKFIVRNHSEVPFLANEGIAFDWMLKYAKQPNVYMSCNAPRMLEESRFLIGKENPEWDESTLTRKVPYLPNYYPTDKCPEFGAAIDLNSEFVNVGCFGAVRPLKNTMLQAIAAMAFATKINKRLRFHINGGRIEMGGSPILKNLFLLFSHFPEYELINHPWKTHKQFKEIVASMDVVSQVSFSETFNIVAADAVTQNIPTITSDEITWSAPEFRADPTSSLDIAETLYRAYMSRLADPSRNPSLFGLEQYNKDSVREWLPYIASFKV
jgi:hypothetical protein